MRLTTQHLYDTFPTMRALSPPGSGPRAILAALEPQICAFTDNWTYAKDLAAVIMDHIADTPYSATPPRFLPYRATTDAFLQGADPARATTYLRALCRATALPRRPRAFRNALLSIARQHRLPISTAMLAHADDTMTVPVRVRLPRTLAAALRDRAAATGDTLTDIIRRATYDALQKETP
jgi:hypothetical protein